ncbi:MAG: aminotransferase class I/II-fold pyridoxal phosphate-dependent enzyme [Clostridia bacterium]|nr:aminotransferase class I/II-fold pyridoxal phosphate-dependent enzyme [Clostridia bacterium]
MFVSRTVKENEPQLVRKLYDKSKEYSDVADLTLGDPDIPTPKPIIDAACRALGENKTKYTANAGITELREAIGRDVKKRLGVYYSTDEIAVTAGAMGGLYLSAASVLDPGDEMIILEPHWPNYTNMVKMTKAAPIYVNCLEGAPEELAGKIERAVTDKTKAVIINSPSNPTGAVLTFEQLKGIAGIAKKHDLWVLSDEVYHTIVFEGECRSILEIEGMKERTILIDSVSKRFSMTGFRVGFVCAPKEIASAVATLEENVNSCACMFAQYASVAALENSSPLEKAICETFRKRCRAMTNELRKSKNLVLGDAVSTFYLFVDIKKTGLTSEEFAYGLLDEKHIAVVPGNAFNKAGEGYIRIACTLSEEKLVAAARKIVEFADKERS